MERLKRALQQLVDEDYESWGGVSAPLRVAVAAFNDINSGDDVIVPEDAD